MDVPCVSQRQIVRTANTNMGAHMLPEERVRGEYSLCFPPTIPPPHLLPPDLSFGVKSSTTILLFSKESLTLRPRQKERKQHLSLPCAQWELSLKYFLTTYLFPSHSPESNNFVTNKGFTAANSRSSNSTTTTNGTK